MKWLAPPLELVGEAHLSIRSYYKTPHPYIMHGSLIRIAITVALASFSLYVSRAQELKLTAANPDSALQTILKNLEGSPLQLREAVHSALSNATSVLTAEAVYRAANGASRREAGTFDPSLFFSFNRLTQDQPTASFFSGATILTTTQNTAAGGLRINLPTGTGIEASLNALTLNSNSSFVNLNPQYTTFGNVSIRQPLLKGFTVSGNKNSAKADRDLEAAKARYDQEVLAISTQVEQSYWDLYAAERDYAVQQLTCDRAEAFLRETETRARAGLVGPNQVASARTFLAEQEILLIDREEQLDDLSDALSSLIGERPGNGKIRHVCVENPPEVVDVGDADSLVSVALNRNLELQAAKADIESRRALSHAAMWEALPSLDFVASIGANGLGGTGQPVYFSGDTLQAMNSGSFRQAITQVLKRQFPAWSLGFELNVPIGLRNGLGEEERLDAEVVIAEQRLVQEARIIEEAVRTSCRELLHAKRRMVAAREGVDAAQEQIRIGLVEFQNGRSTAFELVRLGADFAVAQQQYSQALVRSAKAAATLRQLISEPPNTSP